MINAGYKDKARVIDILSQSFDDNQSVNYIIPQDKRRKKRIRSLMAYSFDVCYHYGKIFLTEDKNSCALLLLPGQKKSFLRSAWLDVRLLFTAVGIRNTGKVLNRESAIKQLQPIEPMYYLWFIGVDPAHQHKQIGSALLREIISECTPGNSMMCLETSTVNNLPWYRKFGFTVYSELDLGYTLYFLKRKEQVKHL